MVYGEKGARAAQDSPVCPVSAGEGLCPHRLKSYKDRKENCVKRAKGLFFMCVCVLQIFVVYYFHHLAGHFWAITVLAALNNKCGPSSPL